MLTTMLWFDDQAEAAARFYTSVFKDAKLGQVDRYSEAVPDKAGEVMLVEFELSGQRFSALNGGKQDFSFNDSISFVIPCQDQDEVDYYWQALTDGGGQPVACGWLKDKYGVRWQVVPDVFFEMMRDPDVGKRTRVTAAMLAMTKLDIAALQKAYAG